MTFLGWTADYPEEVLYILEQKGTHHDEALLARFQAAAQEYAPNNIPDWCLTIDLPLVGVYIEEYTPKLHDILNKHIPWFTNAKVCELHPTIGTFCLMQHQMNGTVTMSVTPLLVEAPTFKVAVQRIKQFHAKHGHTLRDIYDTEHVFHYMSGDVYGYVDDKEVACLKFPDA